MNQHQGMRWIQANYAQRPELVPESRFNKAEFKISPDHVHRDLSTCVDSATYRV